MQTTTIAISFATKRLLDSVKDALSLKSYDDTVTALAKANKKLLIKPYFGAAKNKNIPEFKREKDDRSFD